jgi:glycogen operon protein
MSTRIGNSCPIGATLVAGGVNFSVYSRDARGVELLLFDGADDVTPARTVRFDPLVNRTFHY